jgi:uncharacterized protein (TIGR02996 family)
MLSDLLDRWRQAPHPLLADVIDTVPIELRSFRTNAAAVRWSLEAVGHRRPEDLPTILEAAYRSRATKDATRIVQALLVHWPDDPRMTTVFGYWLQNPPWVGRSSQTVWGRVQKVLMRTADPRAAALGELPADRLFGGATGDWLAEKLARLASRTFPIPSTFPGELDAWTARLTAHRQAERARQDARETAERLWQAVFDAPDDLSQRAILADALADLGDAYGEFVQLQLGPSSRTTDRRIRALLKAHGTTWAGPLDRVLLKGGRVWNQGFLTGGRLRVRAMEDAERAGADPRWQLFERLGIPNPLFFSDPLHALLRRADLRRLSTVDDVEFAMDLTTVLELDAPLARIELSTSSADIDPWMGRRAWTGSKRPLRTLRLAGAWLSDVGRLREHVRPATVELPLDAVWNPGMDPVARVREVWDDVTPVGERAVVVDAGQQAPTLVAAGIPVADPVG